ncbi:hypothetical protein GCM10027059_36750 [Myceligenerans halotolerans]
MVRRVAYFGHDAVVELDTTEASGLRARVLGTRLPAPGERVGVRVGDGVRTFPRQSEARAGDPGVPRVAAH